MNLFQQDPNFWESVKGLMDDEMRDWAEGELNEFSEMCKGIDERAVHTDREGQPKLIKYDRLGDDISHIWLNEGYKKTIQETYDSGIVGYVHKEIPAIKKKGNYIYSYAQGYLLSQVEPGFYCPVTLTMATAYLLDHFADEELKRKYLPHVLSTGEVELYEGATFLSERQGGSDVGANETKAINEEDGYRLYGEKYFASNSGACGVATVLARIEGAPEGTKGLSLFLVPWRNDDGSLNNIQIRRLKDKLGVRAVPSAEVLLEGSKAYLIGDPTKGFYYMMEALNLSRVCNAVASIGIMRRAYQEGLNYAKERGSFGKEIIEFPMVKETLANLVARQEVQTRATFHTISLFDKVMPNLALATENERALLRLFIALIKMRTAEEAIDFAHEAIELHGGNGYMEDFVTPRLLRDAQVLTVWEGTANILGLEILRLIKKYKVHELFIEFLREEIGNLPSELEEVAQPIASGIKELVELLHYLNDKDVDVQTYHSKKVANLMADLYISLISLKDSSDNSRKTIIAKLFLDHIWGKSKIDKEMIALKHFEEITGIQLKKSKTVSI